MISEGTLPKGTPVKDLLMHVDAGTNQPAPEVDAAFIYMTKEGNMGLIEVTRQSDSSSPYEAPRKRADSSKGASRNVKFNMRSIIP